MTQRLLENEGLHDATAEGLKRSRNEARYSDCPSQQRFAHNLNVTVARKKAWKQRRQDCSVIGVAQMGIHCASTAGMFHVSPFYKGTDLWAIDTACYFAWLSSSVVTGHQKRQRASWRGQKEWKAESLDEIWERSAAVSQD